MSALTILYFYPRSPCGERPVTARIIDPTFGFLSTLSLRRATNNVLPAYAACGISIHALLAESDEAQDGYKDTVTEFLSTLSLRRATSAPVACGPDADISIHALLAESDATTANKALQKIISIHALLAESDTVFSIFQVVIIISIHALLAESDKLLPLSFNVTIYFYPRSPCGERPIFAVRPYDAPIFLSTLSLRRATVCPPVGSLVLFISIHALLAESDQRYHRQAADRGYFYPRSPCGERLPADLQIWAALDISIHALLAESDFSLLAGLLVAL